MPDSDLAETTLDSRVVHEGYLTFRVDRVRDAEGGLHSREVVEHPGAIAVLALDGDRIVLVRQFRAAVGEVLTEIPAGTRDRMADGSAEPEDDTARRELIEETGHEAARWRKLGVFYTAPGFATEKMHLYLAQDLTPVEGYSGPAPDERLELVWMPWREAVERAARGEIHDAKTLVGLLWLERLDARGELDAKGASAAG